MSILSDLGLFHRLHVFEFVAKVQKNFDKQKEKGKIHGFCRFLVLNACI